MARIWIRSQNGMSERASKLCHHNCLCKIHAKVADGSFIMCVSAMLWFPFHWNHIRWGSRKECIILTFYFFCRRRRRRSIRTDKITTTTTSIIVTARMTMEMAMAIQNSNLAPTAIQEKSNRIEFKSQFGSRSHHFNMILLRVFVILFRLGWLFDALCKAGSKRSQSFFSHHMHLILNEWETKKKWNECE